MTEKAIRPFCVAGVLRAAVGLVSLCVACSSGTFFVEESASEAQSPDSTETSTATNQPNPANGSSGDVPGSVVGSPEPASPPEPAMPSEPAVPSEPAAQGSGSVLAPEGAEDPASVDPEPSPDAPSPDAPSPDAASPGTPSMPDAPEPSPAEDAGMGPEGAAGASSLVDGGRADSGRSCDTRDLLCRRAEPLCPEGQVPEIVNNCYGECVRIDACECDAPEACPRANEFTCLQSTGRCSYYLL